MKLRHSAAVWARVIATTWRSLRALARDDAYERYLSAHEEHGGTAPLSRRDFYLREQQRKWSGISRCC